MRLRVPTSGPGDRDCVTNPNLHFLSSPSLFPSALQIFQDTLGGFISQPLTLQILIFRQQSPRPAPKCTGEYECWPQRAQHAGPGDGRAVREPLDTDRHLAGFKTGCQVHRDGRVAESRVDDTTAVSVSSVSVSGLCGAHSAPCATIGACPGAWTHCLGHGPFS